MATKKIKCPNCQTMIDEQDFDNHMNYCQYVPNNKEFENLIPCEFCNNYIEFKNYNQHISTCSSQNVFGTLSQLFNLNIQNISESGINNTIINNQVDANITNEENSNEENPNEQSLNEENINEENTNEENNEANQNQVNTNNLDNLNTHNVSNIPENNHIASLINLINIMANQSNIVNNNYGYNEYEDLQNLGNEIGDVNLGIKLDDYVKKYDLPSKCPICFNDKNDGLVITNCSHIFCEKCLKQWVENHNKCPVCMIELKKNIN